MVTEVNKTIGGSSPDYADFDAWELDTDNNIVSEDKLERGQFQVEEDNGSGVVFVGVATVDATRYREITFGGTGTRYDSESDTGSGITSSNSGATIEIQENEFRMTGIHVENTGAGLALVHDFATGASPVLDGCTFRSSTGGNCVEFDESVLMRNCICIADDSSVVAAILITTSVAGITIDNCTLHTPSGNEAQVGINFLQDDTSTTIVRNTVATRFGDNLLDFRFAGASSNGTYSNNASSDTSAPGSDSHTSETDTDLFTDPANEDYSVKSTGNLADGGIDLSGSFTTSYTGTTRATPYDIGAHDFVAAGGGLSIPVAMASYRRRHER